MTKEIPKELIEIMNGLTTIQGLSRFERELEEISDIKVKEAWIAVILNNLGRKLKNTQREFLSSISDMKWQYFAKYCVDGITMREFIDMSGLDLERVDHSHHREHHNFGADFLFHRHKFLALTNEDWILFARRCNFQGDEPLRWFLFLVVDSVLLNDAYSNRSFVDKEAILEAIFSNDFITQEILMEVYYNDDGIASNSWSVKGITEKMSQNGIGTEEYIKANFPEKKEEIEEKETKARDEDDGFRLEDMSKDDEVETDGEADASEVDDDEAEVDDEVKADDEVDEAVNEDYEMETNDNYDDETDDEMDGVSEEDTNKAIDEQTKEYEDSFDILSS